RVLAASDPRHLAALAVVRAEAAWLADPQLAGALPVWLFGANALGRPPAVTTDEPSALEVESHWPVAARFWKEAGCPYEHATLLALRGSESDKREALAIFERLGASTAARALRRQFRAEGVKGVPRGSRRSTQTHPHGLTTREVEVLGLLSQGLRNSAIAKRL